MVRHTSKPRSRLLAFLVACMWAALSYALTSPIAAAAQTLTDRLRAVSQVMCAGDMDVAPERGATLLGERRFQEKRTENWLRDWRLTDGGMIRVTRGERVGAPVLYFVAYYAGKNGRRPMMRLVWDDRCALRGGERIVYDKNGLGAAIRLELLDPELHLRAAPIPLNPPVPEGTPRADCTRVGLLDNGVNYLLPQIAARLARDPNGALVGRDFWEADDRPFDFGVPDGDPDPRLSAFDPPQHGTGLASVLIADTPAQICLAIYRYSPPDIRNEIEGIVDRMAADGVRVVVMASGRDRAWPAFRSAMLAHPELLFIAAAGNDGADLRQRALYPMVYAVPNQLVVTAVTAEGAVWPPGNTGAGIVALALPAVGVPGLAFDGRRVGLTGTSYAAPRAGAVAAALARANPAANGETLRAMVIRAMQTHGRTVDGIVRLDEVDLRAVLSEHSPQK